MHPILGLYPKTQHILHSSFQSDKEEEAEAPHYLGGCSPALSRGLQLDITGDQIPLRYQVMWASDSARHWILTMWLWVVPSLQGESRCKHSWSKC